ncbi:hypothetical protein MBT84_23270 [Streptomyces sp. MBT84]|nr:hypothetical protein [Streptomyces sp. MBT84]
MVVLLTGQPAAAHRCERSVQTRPEGLGDDARILLRGERCHGRARFAEGGAQRGGLPGRRERRVHGKWL